MGQDILKKLESIAASGDIYNITSKELSEWSFIFNKIEQHDIPNYYSNYKTSVFGDKELPISSVYIRDLYVKNCGFSLLSKDWIEPLAKWIGDRKCLEVMSGNGALAKSLQDYGVSVLPTDNNSWENEFENKWTEVVVEDAVEAVKKYGSAMDIIIMSWPPYEEDVANNVLLTMREVNPDAVMIYIGESEGGCTANDSFFDNIQFVMDDSFYNAVKEYKTFFGLHDRPNLIK